MRSLLHVCRVCGVARPADELTTISEVMYWRPRWRRGRRLAAGAKVCEHHLEELVSLDTGTKGEHVLTTTTCPDVIEWRTTASAQPCVRCSDGKVYACERDGDGRITITRTTLPSVLITEPMPRSMWPRPSIVRWTPREDLEQDAQAAEAEGVTCGG